MSAVDPNGGGATLVPGTGLANPMTTPGDLIVGGASGAPGRLAAGAEGRVLTVSSGVPAWVAPAGGGPTIGSGTYAARPASPTEGDSYTVTSGVRRGSVYRCDAAGVWALVTVAVPQLGAALGLFDGESIQGRVGTNIRRWVNLAPRSVGSDLFYFSGNTNSAAVASPISGVIAHDTRTVTTALQATIPAPAALGPRTIAVLVSPGTSIATTYNHVVSWGEVGKSAGMLSICPRALSADNWGNHYWGSGRDTGIAVAASTWAVVVVTYDGTNARYYLDDDGSGATLIDTHSVALTGDPSAAGFAVNARIGDGEYAQAQTAFAGAWDACLSAGEVTTLTSLLRERYGL